MDLTRVRGVERAVACWGSWVFNDGTSLTALHRFFGDGWAILRTCPNGERFSIYKVNPSHAMLIEASFGVSGGDQ